MFYILIFILLFILAIILTVIGIGFRLLGDIARMFGLGPSRKSNAYSGGNTRQRSETEWSAGTQTNDVYGKENRGKDGKEFKRDEGEYVDFEEVK